MGTLQIASHRGTGARHRPSRSRSAIVALVLPVILLATTLAVTPWHSAHAEPGSLTVRVQNTGAAELSWTLKPDDAWVRIHRSTDSAASPSDGNQLYALPRSFNFADFQVEAGQTYYYTVVTNTGRSAPVAARMPAAFEDRQRTSVLWFTPGAAGTVLSWRLGRDVSPQGRLVIGDDRLRSGDSSAASDLAPVTARSGSHTSDTPIELGAIVGIVDPAGRVLATAQRPSGEHPRIGLTVADIPRLRQLVSTDPTVRGAYQQVLDSVANPTAALGAGDRARNAALAYLVSGEQRHADIAYQQTLAATDHILTQSQPLEASGSLFSALVYDWAYHGWSDQQRATVRDRIKSGVAKVGTMHAPNFDLDSDKASNWVSIVRGGELTAHLAIAGDGDYGPWTQRIPVLIDELRRNLDEAFDDTGWSQEGWDYLSYAFQGLVPAVLSTQAAGIHALDASFARPRIVEQYMKTFALGPNPQRGQYGVGETHGPLVVAPMLFTQVNSEMAPYYTWFFNRNRGPRAAVPDYGGPTGAAWAVVAWPDTGESDPNNGPPHLRSALMNDHGGAYQFRDRYRNADDLIIGVTNRNHAHFGWSGPETFALSMISNGTMWAQSPGKDVFNYALYSAPLVDGKPGPHSALGGSRGSGKTLAAKSFDASGGGYLALDGSINYAVGKAHREIVVDPRAVAGTSGVVAVSDTFADARSRQWDWQLSPEKGVAIDISGATFTFTRDDAWLRGWVLDPDGATLTVTNGALQIRRTGTQAEFKVVLASGRGPVPPASVHGTTVQLGGQAYDTSRLSSFEPSAAPRSGPERPTISMSRPRLPFMPGQEQQVSTWVGWWRDRGLSGPVKPTLELPPGWSARQIGAGARPPVLREGEYARFDWAVTPPPAAAVGQQVQIRSIWQPPGMDRVTATISAPVIPTNWAIGQPSEQSSTLTEAARANDGNTDGMFGHGSVAHTQQEVQPWWQVDLGTSRPIREITTWNRVENSDRGTNFYVFVSDQPFGNASLSEVLARPDVSVFHTPELMGRPTRINTDIQGRYVRVQLASPTAGYLQLAEVEVLPQPGIP